ncbi:MAG: NUDIX domain-containing protein [Alphaproteobacteria bacterium]|nr:NUDIX domain-containing protein [Alphaproteobacteria bacterium]
MKQNIHVVARAVVIDEGQILLCKTIGLSPDFFFLPGGHIEQNESAEQAVLRELKEESGFAFSIRRFLGCLEHSFEPGKNSICHSHECNLIFEAYSPAVRASQPIPQLEEQIELLWMPLVQLNNIDLRPEPFKTLVEKWLAQDMNQAFQSHMEYTK